MESMDLSLSLDDIITQKGSRQSGRGGGGRGRGRGSRGGVRRISGGRPASFGGGRVTRRNVDGMWSHDKFADMNGVPRRFSGGGGGGLNAGLRGGAKLVIGNLDYGVSEADLKELFGEFGQILEATINYDISGRSLGKADLTFARRSSAQAAIAKYSGIPLDGRPMDIQWATATGLSAPAVPRVLNRISRGRVGGGGIGRGMNKPQRGGAGGGRGGGRGRGGRGNTTKVPTAAELDAELDAYVSQSSK